MLPFWVLPAPHPVMVDDQPPPPARFDKNFASPAPLKFVDAFSCKIFRQATGQFMVTSCDYCVLAVNVPSIHVTGHQKLSI